MEWAGFLGGTFTNRLMEWVTEDNHGMHMALYNFIVNFGILTDSFLGNLLGNWTGLQTAMLIGCVLQIITSFVVWQWG